MKKFLLILLICLLAQINHRESRLTDTQIASLRETYPIYGVKIPPLIEMHTPAFTEVKNSVETFVYGEVVGEDGYVLSAYEESDVNYSGLKIEELLKRLKSNTVMQLYFGCKTLHHSLSQPKNAHFGCKSCFTLLLHPKMCFFSCKTMIFG